MNCALKTDGAVILRNCLNDKDLASIDTVLSKKWKAFRLIALTQELVRCICPK